MTAVATPVDAPPERPAKPRASANRRRRTLHGKETRGAWYLLTPYALLFLFAAAIPIVFAFYISLQKPSSILAPQGGFGGLESFGSAIGDFRFISTFINIFTVMAIWLPIMLIAIVGLALLVHSSPGRFGGAMRFIYYIPGALGGVANFMLWVYLINPAQSPLAGLWAAMGFDNIKEVTAEVNVPFILAAMLFFQGVGTWIVIVNGGLNGIPDEIFEAASLDGANAWQLTWRIKLPMIRPWIGYAALMNVAYGFQLFLEPYLLDQVASGSLPDQWAPTELGYAFAFTNRNLPAAAAMSIILLVITLGIGLLIVFRSGLFGEEEKK